MREKSSGSDGGPGTAHMWTCESIRPGQRYLPERSMTYEIE